MTLHTKNISIGALILNAISELLKKISSLLKLSEEAARDPFGGVAPRCETSMFGWVDLPDLSNKKGYYHNSTIIKFMGKKLPQMIDVVAHAKALMAAQPEGEKGSLRIDGFFNVFYADPRSSYPYYTGARDGGLALYVWWCKSTKSWVYDIGSVEDRTTMSNGRIFITKGRVPSPWRIKTYRDF